MKNKMNYLKTIPFSEFVLWDVKRFIKKEISSSFPIVNLGDYINQRSEKVKLFNFPEEDFGILGVNNKEGIFDAYSKKGELINQAYKKVKLYDLAYNPYRVNVGSIGWKTDSQKNTFISPAYVVFECLNELSSEFLYRMFKTETFNKIINDNTTGSVRQNLKYDTLKNIKIPLLPKIEQDKIVKGYNQKIALAQQQEQQAEQLEKDIETYLFEALGIEKLKEKESKKGLQFVAFKDTSRWDSLFLIGNIPTLKAKYPISKFNNIIEYFNKGKKGKSIRINTSQYPNEDFRYIGMEHIEKESGRLLELNSVKGKEIKSQTLKVPKGFLLFGKLRPYLNKYWLNDTDFSNIICSSEFFVFETNKIVDSKFFKYVLSSSFIQSQISDKTSGARMPRINEDIFMNLQFPLPENIETQKEIANHISGLKEQIKALKARAIQNRQAAITNFEKEIFN